jgi:hypothetical protein
MTFVLLNPANDADACALQDMSGHYPQDLRPREPSLGRHLSGISCQKVRSRYCCKLLCMVSIIVSCCTKHCVRFSVLCRLLYRCVRCVRCVRCCVCSAAMSDAVSVVVSAVSAVLDVSAVSSALSVELRVVFMY